MRLFDSHCHLYFPQYEGDLPEVLARMREKEMGAVVIGTDLATSKKAVELASSHDFLWAAVGLHPNDPDGKTTSSNGAGEWIRDFEKLAKHPKVVAVGECGLDYFRSGGTSEEQTIQKDRFLKHIELAEKTQKALVVHCRNAHEDMLEVLAEEKPSVPVIIHFFTGSAELAQKYLDLGCYLSFPGPITYTDMYDESITVCPMERMLVETDAPFAAPVPFRGKRNEPAYVEHMAAKIAAVKNLTVEQVVAQTTQNAQKVFNIA